MNQHRAGEKNDPIPFRNDRFFCSNGEWYFEARNGEQHGPYENKSDMEAELLMFIRSKALARQAITT